MSRIAKYPVVIPEKVEITIIEEPQSVWLAFLQKELDYINVPPAFAPNAFDGDKLKPELAQQGITHYRAIDPEITYTMFNIRDPIVGGFAKEKIALRRALAMAYDVDREVEVLRKRQAVHAQMPIPEGVVGHDAKQINRQNLEHIFNAHHLAAIDHTQLQAVQDQAWMALLECLDQPDDPVALREDRAGRKPADLDRIRRRQAADRRRRGDPLRQRQRLGPGDNPGGGVRSSPDGAGSPPTARPAAAAPPGL